MNYIVLDFEFNSVPFGQKKKEDAQLQLEIIEIGAVKLNHEFVIGSKFQSFIQPFFYKKLNQRVKQMTNIRQNQLDTAQNFTKVMESFLNWLGNKEYILCTWGKDDIRVLNQHCKYYNIDLQCTEYIDIQKLFTNYFKLENQSSLKNAIESMELRTDHSFHSALNDALYTERILRKLLLSENFELHTSKYMEQLPLPKSSELDVLMDDTCPICGMLLKAKGKQWMQRKRKLVRYFRCKNCDIQVCATWKNGVIIKKPMQKKKELRS